MRKLILKTAITVAALSASLAAFADPTLLISDGVTTVGPVVGADGSVVYVNGAFDASWSVVITAGTSKPIFGSGANPNMELTIQATSLGSTPVQDLTITLSDTDFGPVSGTFSALINGQPFGGPGGTVTYNTYYDSSNQVLVLTTPITTSGPLLPDATQTYNSFVQGPTISGSPFSLSEVVTISGQPASSYSLGANLQEMDVACAGGTGQVGTPYSSALTVNGGVAPYTFSIVSGTLPPGLMLDTNSGAITGTPTAAGTFPYVAKVVDSAGRTADTTALNCGITVTSSLSLACAGGTGQVGVPYSSAVVASGGTQPYTSFAIIGGSLPPGLSLNPLTGAITGIPTMAGTFPYTAQVTDSSGGTVNTAVLNCNIVIAPQACTGSICGSVLRDCDANGNLSGEAGLAGVTVVLKDSGGNTVAMMTTGSSGSYCFTGLTGSNYVVVAATPAGYKVTVPSGTTQIPITLASCANTTGVNFGFTGTNAMVQIIKTGPPSATCGEIITYQIAVTNTGNTCFYGGLEVYDSLFPGRIFYQSPVYPGQGFLISTNYTVKSTDPTNLVNTATAIGHPPIGNAVTNTSSVKTVLTPCCSASICGEVFRDCNADGSITGDTGLAGVAVTLKTSTGTIVGASVTDSNGNYCFYNLNAGNYRVVVTPPAHYKQTTCTIVYRCTDYFGNPWWLDSDNNLHCKDQSGVHHWYDTSWTHHCESGKGARYCDATVPNCMSKCDGEGVDIDDSAGKTTWTQSGCKHWRDSDGRDCWVASDGCIHRKDSNNNECWRTTDLCTHWVDCTGKNCWKDKNGNCFHLDSHGNTCSDVCDEKQERCSRSDNCDNEQAVCLATCEGKNNVNFGFTGTAPAISLTQTANKTTANCGDTITYTFVVTDTGNTCFYGGITVCDSLLGGTIFSQTPVSPGQSFTFTKQYVVTSSCQNPLVSTATATGHVPTGIGLSDVTSTASTSVTLSLCASCSPPSGSCSRGSSKTFTCNPCFGAGPYTYHWSNGCRTQSATCNSSGTYTCTVTDSKGKTCTASATLTTY